MAVRLTYVGSLAAAIAVIVLLLRFAIEDFGIEKRAWDNKKDPSTILHAFITGTASFLHDTYTHNAAGLRCWVYAV